MLLTLSTGLIQTKLIAGKQKGEISIYAGWLKKVSHYQESSLNRIKDRQCGYISHQF